MGRPWVVAAVVSMSSQPETIDILGLWPELFTSLTVREQPLIDGEWKVEATK